MAFLHRVLLTWFLGLVFLILLVIRLDPRNNWNWFIVFIPLWLFDVVVLTYSIFYIVSRLKTDPHQIFTPHVRKKFYVLGTVMLKMTTQTLICLKLSSWNLPLYYICIPIWCMLTIGLVRVILILGNVSALASIERLRLNCLRRLRRTPTAPPVAPWYSPMFRKDRKTLTNTLSNRSSR